ncbi:hypothetical protein C8F01DRAFT_1379306 [Mycena amicta]|nr:hypothetical protein C8F01DRAFT_1379306 [Mycena amicta]
MHDLEALIYRWDRLKVLSFLSPSMPVKLSADLKQHTAAVYLEDGIKMADITKSQRVSIGLVSKVPTGAVLNDDDRAFLRALHEANAILYLDEIQEKLLSVHNVSVSIATLCRELRKMCLVRKKVSKAAAEPYRWTLANLSLSPPCLNDSSVLLLPIRACHLASDVKQALGMTSSAQLSRAAPEREQPLSICIYGPKLGFSALWRLSRSSPAKQVLRRMARKEYEYSEDAESLLASRNLSQASRYISGHTSFSLHHVHNLSAYDRETVPRHHVERHGLVDCPDGDVYGTP